MKWSDKVDVVGERVMENEGWGAVLSAGAING